MPHILIIEDEAAIADTLVYALQLEGFSTKWLGLAGDALEYLKQHQVDLIILDVGLPDMSGFDLCKNLRRDSDLPIMFLTARGDEIDRIVGLEIGADDYVVKPFSPREVTARVKTILKRVRPQKEEPSQNETSCFHVDNERFQIHFHKQPLHLTRYEFRLLQTLLSQPDRVFSREQLLTAMDTSTEAGYERSIDGHIKSLRAKLRTIAPNAEPIQTHRGLGYSYNPALN